MNMLIDDADRARWNAIYRSGSHTAGDPDRFFLEAWRDSLAALFEGRVQPLALDIAGGVGRHALWLAARGWRVVLNDISEEAARLAGEAARAAHLSLSIRAESAAATLAWAGEQGLRFDLVLVLFYLDRSLFPALAEALAPGGVLLIKTRTEDHPRFAAGSHHPEYFLKRDELHGAFPGLRVLHSREEAGMAELLVQKL